MTTTNTANATQNTFTHLKPPSKLLFLIEGRSLLEFGAGIVTLPLIKKIAPKGDGQPVLVLPGLGAGNISTKLLRVFLKELGYESYGWELGTNKGMLDGTIDSIAKQIQQIQIKHGRKVSVIGQSLGGIFAREVAKAVPDLVRQVITLGSPFTGSIDATNAQFAYTILKGSKVTDKEREFFQTVKVKPPVPTTSVYSKADGVVAWECSIETNTDKSENIELVGASHIGMASSPSALYLIAHRLAEKENHWTNFQPHGIMKSFYK